MYSFIWHLFLMWHFDQDIIFINFKNICVIVQYFLLKNCSNRFFVPWNISKCSDNSLEFFSKDHSNSWSLLPTKISKYIWFESIFCTSVQQFQFFYRKRQALYKLYFYFLFLNCFWIEYYSVEFLFSNFKSLRHYFFIK